MLKGVIKFVIIIKTTTPPIGIEPMTFWLTATCVYILYIHNALPKLSYGGIFLLLYMRPFLPTQQS